MFFPLTKLLQTLKFNLEFFLDSNEESYIEFSAGTSKRKINSQVKTEKVF